MDVALDNVAAQNAHMDDYNFLPLLNCKLIYQHCCPQWYDLQTTSRPDARWCHVCHQSVLFCASIEEALHYAEQGHPIVRKEQDLPPELEFMNDLEWSRAWSEGEVFLTEEQHHTYIKYLDREGDINSALANVQHTRRRCVSCSFPFPAWWKKCRVCGSSEYIIKVDSSD